MNKRVCVEPGCDNYKLVIAKGIPFLFFRAVADKNQKQRFPNKYII